MASGAANILDANAYTVAGHPYLVEQMAAAAIKELQRRREPAKEEAREPLVDPEALRQREEAAQLRSQAERALRAAEAKAKETAQLAEAEAEHVKAAAKAEAYQEGFTRGTEEGYEAGLKKGEDEGLAKYTEAVARFEAFLSAAVKEKEAWFADREALLVELAIRVAAKVIAREASSRPDHVAQMLKQALKRLNERSKLLVTLHPEDLEKVTQARTQGALSFTGVKQIEFLADEKMVPGGLKIQSGAQTLDATLENQLAEVCRALLEEAYHGA